MRLNIKTKFVKYPIIVHHGLIKSVKLLKNGIIITDKNVKKIYGKYFRKNKILAIDPGENSKKLKIIEQLAEQLIKLKANRQTILVALGGGVVGDITGFLAAIYMRGINFIQIPTTLLSMVDASIGGKTGVNLKSGKNLIGSFYQPQAVYIDPQVLQTLPEKEFQNGIAEVIKHGVIDGKLFFWLEKNKEKIKNKDPKILEQLIYKNVLIKKKIIAQDEKEKNIRAILNLGHTFGHAMETLSNYKISHGQAVAIGLAVASQREEKIINLLSYFGLTTRIPKKMDVKKIVEIMRADKKNQSNKITVVIPEKIGKVKIVKNYPIKKIISCLSLSK